MEERPGSIAAEKKENHWSLKHQEKKIDTIETARKKTKDARRSTIQDTESAIGSRLDSKN